VTPADTARKIGRAVMAWTDHYEAHPFAVTFRLLGLVLAPVTVWLLVVIGLLWLISAGKPIPADPVKASNTALGLGLLAGTAATAGAYGVVSQLAKIRRRRAK
jgi:hypothetical protein